MENKQNATPWLFLDIDDLIDYTDEELEEEEADGKQAGE